MIDKRIINLHLALKDLGIKSGVGSVKWADGRIGSTIQIGNYADELLSMGNAVGVYIDSLLTLCFSGHILEEITAQKHEMYILEEENNLKNLLAKHGKPSRSRKAGVTRIKRHRIRYRRGRLKRLMHSHGARHKLLNSITEEEINIILGHRASCRKLEFED